MPRIYREQPEYERYLIREFLCDLGYRISRPKWQDKPDALVTLSKGKCCKRVAIEHTDYFNDTVAGQRSSITLFDEFWRIVQGGLVRRISHRSQLTGILGSVRFRENLSKPNNRIELARQLAKELVDFTEAHPVAPSERLRWCSRDFDEKYPTMQSLLASVLLSRWTNDAVFASRCSWICSNVATGNIGFSLRYVETAIENKNEKACNYDWDNADEKWLLIAASGATLSNQAGPPIQNENWADAKLTELCRNSPFDRIIFWERIRCWYKWLKPDSRTVQYRNPYVE